MGNPRAYKIKNKIGKIVELKQTQTHTHACTHREKTNQKNGNQKKNGRNISSVQRKTTVDKEVSC